MVKNGKKIEENPERNIMSDKSRHIIVAVIAAILLILIIVLSIVGNTDNKTKFFSGSSDNSSSNSTSNLETSNTSNGEKNKSTDFLKKFYDAFESKEEKLIFFARTSCGYCSLQKPILKQVVEDYNLDYFNVDTDKLESSETSEIMSALGIDGSTPNSVVVKDGKVIATSNGYLDGKEYVAYLVKNGILEEGSTYKPEEKLKEIDYEEFKEISKEAKTNLVFLDTTACPNCITARTVINKLAEKNDFSVYYLSAAYLTQSDVENLTETDFKEMEYSESNYKSNGNVSIPLLLVIKDNKIVDYVLEKTEESDYKEVLEKYGFIK